MQKSLISLSFLLFFMLFISLSSSVSLVSSEVLNPSNGNKIFTDSQDVTVKFSFDGFASLDDEYKLIITKPDFYANPIDSGGTVVSDNINTSLCAIAHDCYYGLGVFKNFKIVDPSQNGVFTLSYHLNQLNAINPADFDWNINKYDIGTGDYTISSGSGSETIPVTPGNPVVETPTIYDLNSNEELATIGKNHSFMISVKVKDNTDDTAGEALICTATIGTKTATNNSGATWEQKDMNIGPFNASEIGQGTNTVTVVCNDGVLLTTKSTTFSITDSKPVVSGVTVSPTTPYPDSEISCQYSGATDDDDPASIITVSYRWYLNGTAKAGETTSKFICTPTTCPQATEVKCSITPSNNQTGVETYSGLGVIKGYFSVLTISSPDKAQVGEKITLTADYTYGGTGTVSYEWDFGDNSTAGTTKTLERAFAKEGSYEVKLKIKDDKGSWLEETKTIQVVSANLNIVIKEPLVNADILRNEEYKVRVQLLDNAGKVIPGAKVTAQLKEGVVFDLKETSSGNYEGSFVPTIYNDAKNFVEISADVTSGGLSLKSSKSVEIYIVPNELIPILDLNTSFAGEQGAETFSIGSKINFAKICFKDKDSENYSVDINSGKIILQGYENKEYGLEKQDDCFVSYLDYGISDKDVSNGSLYFKFDVADKFGNYVAKTYKSKEYEVKNVTGIIDLELIFPDEKIDTLNYGQEIPIQVKIKSEKEITPVFVYVFDNKEYYLEQDKNDLYLFTGKYKVIDKTGDKKIIDFVAQAEYNGVLVTAKKTREFKLTNKLNIELINPSETGSYFEADKLKIKINYENGLSYDKNTITLTINGEEKTFSLTDENIYETDFGLKLFGAASISFDGSDELGNVLQVEKAIPFMSPLVSINAWLLILLVVVGLLLLYFIYWRINKVLSKAQKGKSVEEIEEDLETSKKTLSQITRDMFQQKISQEEFQKQKTGLEQKISVLSAKLETKRNKQDKTDETIKEASKDNLSPEEKRKMLIKSKFESDVYTKYKEKIDDLVSRLKPVKTSYTKEEIEKVLEKEEFPKEVVEEIIKRLY